MKDKWRSQLGEQGMIFQNIREFKEKGGYKAREVRDVERKCVWFWVGRVGGGLWVLRVCKRVGGIKGLLERVKGGGQVQVEEQGIKRVRKWVIRVSGNRCERWGYVQMVRKGVRGLVRDIKRYRQTHIYIYIYIYRERERERERELLHKRNG